MLIDGLQYANWSEKIFRQMREGGVDAVHVTITYHETFRETVLQIEALEPLVRTLPRSDLSGPHGGGCDAAPATPGAPRSSSGRRTQAASRMTSAWSRCCTRWACASCS